MFARVGGVMFHCGLKFLRPGMRWIFGNATLVVFRFLVVFCGEALVNAHGISLVGLAGDGCNQVIGPCTFKTWAVSLGNAKAKSEFWTRCWSKTLRLSRRQ
jgi:hypothetical protein